MSENLGKKLQVSATICTIIGFIGSIAGGIFLLETAPVLGVSIIVGGVFSTLVFTRMIRAIGEILDNTYAIQRELSQIKANTEIEIEYEHSDDPVVDATNR